MLPKAPGFFSITGFLLLLSFQAGFAQWDGASPAPRDSLSTSTATPLSVPLSSSPPSPSTAPSVTYKSTDINAAQADLYRLRYNSGSSMYQVGRVLAWGGLAANIIGSFGNVPALSLLGSLGTTVGIPVMGIGAGKAERSSLALNPNGFASSQTGWPVYWTGWGLQVGGAVLVVGSVLSSIDVLQSDSSGVQQNDKEPAIGPLVGGIVAIIAGGICHYVAWYQFSERHDQGVLNMAGLAYVPTLHLDQGRIDGAGLNLTLAF